MTQSLILSVGFNAQLLKSERQCCEAPATLVILKSISSTLVPVFFLQDPLARAVTMRRNSGRERDLPDPGAMSVQEHTGEFPRSFSVAGSFLRAAIITLTLSSSSAMFVGLMSRFSSLPSNPGAEYWRYAL